jgi:hypothetical protein
MMPDEVNALAADGFLQVKDQAKRYMEAVYGKDVWFKAPETFDNILVRWIWAIAASEIDFANVQMTKIEELAAADRAAAQDDDLT